MRVRCLCVAALLLACLPACDPGPCGEEPNELAGSIAELYDVETDGVRARKLEADTVTVEYFRGEDIVTKVVANVQGFRTGAAFPLRDGAVYRVTSPPTDFPADVEAGAITFETGIDVGEDVEGCFTARFRMEDGSQRTLRGAFSTRLEAGF